jgi:hypothetical protein
MPSTETKEFRVHARHVDHHHAHLVREVSFEAAAVAYLEDFPHGPDDDYELAIIVHELASGHEHCFRVNLDTGETAPCA